MLSEAVHLNVENYSLRKLTLIAEVFTGVEQQKNKQITPQKLFYCKLIIVAQHLSGKERLFSDLIKIESTSIKLSIVFL